MKKYILKTFCCSSTLQNAALTWGVLSSVFSSILLITTLSTNIFKDTIFLGPNYYYETTALFWIMAVVSTLHIIASIFLAIGAEKKNELMLMPWIVVQALTFVLFIPIIFCVLLCAAIVCKSWANFSIFIIKYDNLFLIVIVFPVCIWWTVYSLLVSLRIENVQAVETQPTAPSSSDLHSNTFIDIQLPAYNDVTSDSSKRY